MVQTVIGIFNNPSDAHAATEKLYKHGYSENSVDISNHTNLSGAEKADQVNYEEDSISRFFNSLFGNKEQARYYSDITRRSGSIVTVHARSHEEAQKAAEILDEQGAVDIDEQASHYGFQVYSEDIDRNNQGSTDANRTSGQGESGDSGSIPVINEELNVGKKVAETGRKRIKSRIVERPVEERIRLREEKINIERKRVNRPASEKELQNFKEGEVEFVEHKEVPVVSKDAKVVEEVNVSKRVGEREERIKENVRKTDVDVEDIDAHELHHESHHERHQGNKRNF